jgi:tetratricopeptide (TPR) repeat protein
LRFPGLFFILGARTYAHESLRGESSVVIWLRLCRTGTGYLALGLTISLAVSSCRTAELERQAELIKEQDAEIARQRGEIEALKAGQQAEKKKLSDCNRAFRDYFERAQATADRERAIALYRAGVVLCPDDDVARYELGKLLAAEGFHREAEAEFESALKINPVFTDAKARLDALRKSR